MKRSPKEKLVTFKMFQREKRVRKRKKDAERKGHKNHTENKQRTNREMERVIVEK